LASTPGARRWPLPGGGPGGGAHRVNLSADAFLAYAVTRGDLAVVSVLASLAPVVTALCAHALTTERPSAPQTAGAALAVLGTLVVSAAQAAA
jgi:drug/metabolite transporter (DMT)-like permease